MNRPRESVFESGLSHNANNNPPLLAQPETNLEYNLSGIGGEPRLSFITDDLV